jgi:hypothetical protein
MDNINVDSDDSSISTIKLSQNCSDNLVNFTSPSDFRNLPMEQRIEEREITSFTKKTVSFAKNGNLNKILDQNITNKSLKIYQEDDQNNKEKIDFNKSCKSIGQMRTKMFYKTKTNIDKSSKKINSENKSQKDLLNDKIKISMFNDDSFDSENNEKEVDLNTNHNIKLKISAHKCKDFKRNKTSNLDMNYIENFFENDLDFKLKEESEEDDIVDEQHQTISNECSNVFKSNLMINTKLKLLKFEKGEQNLAAKRNKSTSIINMMELNISRKKSKISYL